MPFNYRNSNKEHYKDEFKEKEGRDPSYEEQLFLNLLHEGIIIWHEPNELDAYQNIFSKDYARALLVLVNEHLPYNIYCNIIQTEEESQWYE